MPQEDGRDVINQENNEQTSPWSMIKKKLDLNLGLNSFLSHQLMAACQAVVLQRNISISAMPETSLSCLLDQRPQWCEKERRMAQRNTQLFVDWDTIVLDSLTRSIHGIKMLSVCGLINCANERIVVHKACIMGQDVM